jgi:hypothetical protein
MQAGQVRHSGSGLGQAHNEPDVDLLYSLPDAGGDGFLDQVDAHYFIVNVCSGDFPQSVFLQKLGIRLGGSAMRLRLQNRLRKVLHALQCHVLHLR